jgi:hypothetical protein
MTSGIVRKRWSSLEDENLRKELEQGLSIHSISVIHHRTMKSIVERVYLKKLKIPRKETPVAKESGLSDGSDDSEIFCEGKEIHQLETLPSTEGELCSEETPRIATDKDIVEFLTKKIQSGETYFHVVDLTQIPYFASVWNLKSYDLYEYRFAAILKAVASEYRLSIRPLTRRPSLFEVYQK